MSRILFNLRYSARSFARTPGIALALLITIALGIGSNVTVRGFVLGLTRPSSPLTSIARVVSVFGREANRETVPLSYPEYLSVEGHLDAFEWVGAASESQGVITFAGQSEIMPVAAVTSNLSGLLGLSLDEGVIVSHRMWQDEFGAKADVRGEKIRIDGVDARVSGVAPEWLEGVYRDRGIDVWMPLQEEAQGGLDNGPDRSGRNFWVVGGLRRGVSASQAQTIAQPSRGSAGLRVIPYTGMTPEMAAGLSRIATLLGLAAGAVFFIACANVASFLLGRAFARSHETALRVALGASRGQLARELLFDSIIVSVAGSAAGMLLAAWTSRILPALLYERDARHLVFAPDFFSLLAASAACAGIMILCGLMPVLVIPHDRPATVLKREGSGPSLAIRRLRLGLAAAQMASCCILVVSTAVLIEGLRSALVTSVGHRLGHTFLATVQAEPKVGIHYFERVEAATKSMAGVSGITWAMRLPGSEPIWRSFRIEPAQLPLREVALDIAPFTAGSLTLFTLPPRQGRLFGFAQQACRAVIVNDEAAAELFGGHTAGRTLQDPARLQVEIVGVVAMRRPAKGNRPTIYYDYTNQGGPPPGRIARGRFRAPIASELVKGDLDTNVVSPGYFDAMGLPLVAGQPFTSTAMSGTCRVGIVNREAADLYFGGNAVGAAVIDDEGRRTRIIGVAPSAPLGSFQRHVEPALYFRMSQDVFPRMTMMVQTREAAGPTLADLRRTIEAVPGHGPAPIIVKTLEAYLTQTSLAPLHIATMILGASATTALLLSVLGLFGALSDAARQRRRELAVRIALGAQRWHVIGQVIGEGGRLACLGAAVGMPGSFLVSRWLTGITLGSGSPALWVWLAAPVILAGAVAIASVVPARRALIVNPLMIMREDN